MEYDNIDKFDPAMIEKYLYKPTEFMSGKEQIAGHTFKHEYNVNINEFNDKTKRVIIDLKVYWDVLGKDQICEVDKCNNLAY